MRYRSSLFDRSAWRTMREHRTTSLPQGLARTTTCVHVARRDRDIPVDPPIAMTTARDRGAAVEIEFEPAAFATP